MVEQELKRSSQPAYRHHTNQQQPSPPPPPPPHAPPPAPMGRTASLKTNRHPYFQQV